MSDQKVVPFPARKALEPDPLPERQVHCDVCGKPFMTKSSPFFAYYCSEMCVLQRMHDGPGGAA